MYKIKEISKTLDKLKNFNKPKTIKKLKKYKIIHQFNFMILNIITILMILFFIVLLTIGLFYPIIVKIMHANYNILFPITLMLIVIINVIYYKLKKYHIQQYFVLFLFIFLLFIFINVLSNLISNTLRIGNYYSILIIKNRNICKQINHIYEDHCKINTIVLWRAEDEYIIENNNTTYKIPAQYVLMEFFYNSLDKDNLQKIHKNGQIKELNISKK